MPTTAGDIYVRSGASGSFTAVEYVQGGWITVASSSTMRGIYHDRIEDGQVAYVKSSNELYIASKFVAFSTPGYSGTVDSASWAKLIWPSASVSVAGGGGGGTITALNNQSANRLVTIGSTTTELDGEANLTFDGTTLSLGSSTTASFQRLDAQVISASVVEVDASTLKVGGTEINKTLVDNVKLNFSSDEVQSSDTLETTAATGSFSGFVSSSLFLLSEVQGAQLTPQAGGIMFSGSAFYLGFE
tara:strand:- start:905 stop:1639 length:735 start_codon:yes stop_codon:yes gene_type:complete